VQADLVEVGHQHFDDFGVDGGSVGAAEDFRADLVELAVAAFLRSFAAKHRTGVVELYRLRELIHVVFDVGATDGGGSLRTQAQNFSNKVFLRKMFLDCKRRFSPIHIHDASQSVKYLKPGWRVQERIHLFGDDVGFAAYCSCEEVGWLEDGEADFAVAEGGEDLVGRLLDTVPEFRF